MEPIQEIIVVEGRNDVAAVQRAVCAEVIATHGFGISQPTLEKIQKAYEKKGIIILTDPDFAGEKIRNRLSKQFPDAKHAYLPKCDATKDGDIGVENADPESILQALKKCRCVFKQSAHPFTAEDLIFYELAGSDCAGIRRDHLGRLLGIGYGNAKAFLRRLNAFGITREEFENALKQIEDI